MTDTTTRLVVHDKANPEVGSLWTLFDPVIVPRVGETIEYYINTNDEEKWNPDSLNTYKALNIRVWKVESVHHEYNRSSITNVMHTIHIHVIEIQKEIPSGN